MKTNRVKYPKANLGGQSRKRAIRRRNNASDKARRRNKILVGTAIAAAVVVTGVVIYKHGKGKYSDLPQPPDNAPIPPMYPKPPLPQP